VGRSARFLILEDSAALPGSMRLGDLGRRH
jgi:hypothetical protein